ncbi:MAG: deoxyribose-phosphate aldolase [Arcobacter sp.]|nr:deoxyribose-phosphate aldolase [Arcobacter sp.]
MDNLSKYIDHTLLAQDANIDMIKKLCEEAIENNFYCVCVNSCFIMDVKKFLKNSKVKTCSVVGFPLGAMSTKAKAFEAQVAIEDGADEIDMVINVGWLKSGKFELVKKDILELKAICKDVVLKVILETALLKEEEIVKVCNISKDARVEFVKTSTGFSKRGASLEDVLLMKSVVNDSVQIKASGGIRSYETAIKMIESGASRLGTSSGIAIINKSNTSKDY